MTKIKEKIIKTLKEKKVTSVLLTNDLNQKEIIALKILKPK
jgi:ribosomal protein L7Ae-like RNA K-turn-binding protein